MGRNFENRKNSIFKTAAQKSKLYSKYGTKLYVAAKSGVADPDANPALRSLIEKAKKDQANQRESKGTGAYIDMDR
jgi:transcriptional/translational regulatory protein YebC/TACO1